jgi:transposase
MAALLAAQYNLSSRRATAYPPSVDCRRIFSRGKPPSSVKLRFFMKERRLNNVLRRAIDLCADSVKTIETKFAIDGTYFKMPLSEIHLQRRGKGVMPVEKIKLRKLHIVVGAKTLMVVAASVTDQDVHDSTQFVPLLQHINRRFIIEQMLGDAAYGSREAYEALDACGAEGYLDFKTTSKPQGSPGHDRALEMYRNDEDAWFENYRFRQGVEGTNSIIKRTIKRVLRSRLEKTSENEILTMLLVHNLRRLIVARIEHGVPIPWLPLEVLKAIDAVKAGGNLRAA